ncbi:MAG: hypothetical protein ACX931_04480 [Saccharospirillum sp.]
MPNRPKRHTRVLWPIFLATVLITGCGGGSGTSNPDTQANAAGSSGEDASPQPVRQTWYFSADDGVFGEELWKTDGTADGTERVTNVSLTGDSSPQSIRRLGDGVYFSAIGPDGARELYSHNGVKADAEALGAEIVRDLMPPMGGATFSSNPKSLGTINDRLVFQAEGYNSYPATSGDTTGLELFVSDGSESETVLLKDFSGDAGDGLTNPPAGVVVGDHLYVTGAGLWVWQTDGTPAGTAKLTSPAREPSGPAELTAFSGRLFFVASDTTVADTADVGRELWTYNPLSDTLISEDIYPGHVGNDANDSNPNHLTVVGNQVVFFAQNNIDSTTQGLYRTNNGIAYLIQNLNNPTKLVTLSPEPGNDTFLLVAENSSGEERTFVSDGSSAGTEVLLENGTETPVLNEALGYLGNQLVFSATTAGSGMEPWITDGTASGTVKLRDIVVGASGSSPEPLVDVSQHPTGAISLGRVIFIACDAQNGCEPWVTDGTPGGTALLKNINPNNDASGSTSPVKAP